MQPSCVKLRSRAPSLSAFLVCVEPLISRFCYPQCFFFLSGGFFFPRTGNRSSCGTHRRARRRSKGRLTELLTEVRRFVLPVKVLHTKPGGGAPRTASPENIDAIIARGTALWNSIYEPHAVKLHNKLASYHPDLICMFLLVLFLSWPMCESRAQFPLIVNFVVPCRCCSETAIGVVVVVVIVVAITHERPFF